jgi:hypothetical protein
MQSVQESGKWKGSKKENCSGKGGNFFKWDYLYFMYIEKYKRSHAGIFAYLR